MSPKTCVDSEPCCAYVRLVLIYEHLGQCPQEKISEKLTLLTILFLLQDTFVLICIVKELRDKDEENTGLANHSDNTRFVIFHYP